MAVLPIQVGVERGVVEREKTKHKKLEAGFVSPAIVSNEPGGVDFN